MATIEVESGGEFDVEVSSREISAEAVGAPGFDAEVQSGDEFAVSIEGATQFDVTADVGREYFVDVTRREFSASAQIGSVQIVQGDIVETLPNRTVRGKGANKRYIYVGFSSAPIGSENESDAEWKIYRYDTVTGTSSFADGDELFDNVWDSTGGGPNPTYETLNYP